MTGPESLLINCWMICSFRIKWEGDWLWNSLNGEWRTNKENDRTKTIVCFAFLLFEGGGGGVVTTVQLLKIVLHFYRPRDLSPGLKYGDGRFDVVGDGTNQSLRTVRHKILPILGTSIPRSTIPDRRSTLSSQGIIGDFWGSSQHQKIYWSAIILIIDLQNE